MVNGDVAGMIAHLQRELRDLDNDVNVHTASGNYVDTGSMCPKIMPQLREWVLTPAGDKAVAWSM